MRISFDFDDDAMTLFVDALERLKRVAAEQPWNDDVKQAIQNLEQGIERARVNTDDRDG